MCSARVWGSLVPSRPSCKDISRNLQELQQQYQLYAVQDHSGAVTGTQQQYPGPCSTLWCYGGPHRTWTRVYHHTLTTTTEERVAVLGCCATKQITRTPSCYKDYSTSPAMCSTSSTVHAAFTRHSTSLSGAVRQSWPAPLQPGQVSEADENRSPYAGCGC